MTTLVATARCCCNSKELETLKLVLKRCKRMQSLGISEKLVNTAVQRGPHLCPDPGDFSTGSRNDANARLLPWCNSDRNKWDLLVRWAAAPIERIWAL